MIGFWKRVAGLSGIGNGCSEMNGVLFSRGTSEGTIASDLLGREADFSAALFTRRL